MSNATTTNPTISVGQLAPDFTLTANPGQTLRLREFRGRPVVLVFYPADFSPVCGDQLGIYNEILTEFEHHNAQLLGISVDGPWCHQAYSRQRNIQFPLLADHHPKGDVATRYGVYRANDGVSERALFVIDAGGFIRWHFVSDIAQNPGADGILAALEALAGEKVT